MSEKEKPSCVEPSQGPILPEDAETSGPTNQIEKGEN